MNYIYNTSISEQDKIEHFVCCVGLRKKVKILFFVLWWAILTPLAVILYLLRIVGESLFPYVVAPILVCLFSYKAIPYLARLYRRKEYKKLFGETPDSFQVDITDSYIDIKASNGKTGRFMYEPERRIVKIKDRIIGEILEVNDGIYFSVSKAMIFSGGLLLYIDKAQIGEETYSALTEMLKHRFGEKYYDFSKEA